HAPLEWADHRSGRRYGRGSCSRRLSEMDHVKNICQYGIRGISRSLKEGVDEASEYGTTILSPKQMRERRRDNLAALMSEGEKLYITFDIDGIDPSIAPGTGTPSPGGLLYDEVNELLKAVAKHNEVVGFDLVEVAPVYDPTGMTGQ